MKKIYYWSPHLSNDIATIKSVKNSASSLKDYSNSYSVSILDAVGEWKENKIFFENKKIDIICLGKDIYNSLPRGTFIKSRFSYIKIFFFSFFPLLKILKKNQPDYLIVHLITSELNSRNLQKRTLLSKKTKLKEFTDLVSISNRQYA